MPKPTIDEMLGWLDAYAVEWGDKHMPKAIRAILEQVRASEYLSGTVAEWLVVKRQLELEAIRAFVERVEKRVERDGKGYDDAFAFAVDEELAAMEKEAER